MITGWLVGWLFGWLVGDMWKGPFLIWGVPTLFIRFVSVMCHILI